MEQGGTIANKTGNKLEQFIEDIISAEKYVYVENNKFESGDRVDAEPKIFMKQLNICNGIYENPIRCDFMLFSAEKHPEGLVIESKWQQAKGSVDEKFPYLELNIREKYPYRTIIILDGGGYKPTAEKWLRSKIGGKLISVFSMKEFMIFVNKGGL